MVFVLGNKRIPSSKIFAYLCVLYVLLMSGTVLQIIHMKTLQLVNVGVGFVALCIYLYSRVHTGIKLDFTLSFILLAGVASLTVPSIRLDLSEYKAHISAFFMLLIPWLIVQKVELEDFKRAYLRVIFILALISLIFFSFPELLKFLPSQEYVRENNDWSYDFYYIYVQYQESEFDVLNRNIGVFWEPGMYQGFIIFAMILTAIDKPVNFSTVTYQVIMFICLLTIQSTTGYILLLPLLLIYVLKYAGKMDRFSRVFITVAVLLLSLILLIIPSVLEWALSILPGDVIDKLSVDNISFSTRMYSFLGDFLLAIQNPLGVGIGQVDVLREEMLRSLGAITDGANVNTTFTMMLYYGIVPGIMFLWICIKACMNLTSDRLVNLIVLAMCMVIINTEPHYLTLFFTTIFFYYAKKSARKPREFMLKTA